MRNLEALNQPRILTFTDAVRRIRYTQQIADHALE